MYGFETWNMIAPRGSSGTKNPLKAICRHYENLLTYYKVCKALRNNELFKRKFKRTAKIIFPEIHKQNDKNPEKLVKIFQDKTTIKFYLEDFYHLKKNSSNCNSFIEFTRNYKRVGRIVKISQNPLLFNVIECKKLTSTEHFFEIENTITIFNDIKSEEINHVFGYVYWKEREFLFNVEKQIT